MVSLRHSLEMAEGIDLEAYLTAYRRLLEQEPRHEYVGDIELILTRGTPPRSSTTRRSRGIPRAASCSSPGTVTKVVWGRIESGMDTLHLATEPDDWLGHVGDEVRVEAPRHRRFRAGDTLTVIGRYEGRCTTDENAGLSRATIPASARGRRSGGVRPLRIAGISPDRVYLGPHVISEDIGPSGDRITVKDGEVQVSDRPIVCFIEGDGTGPDIWAASRRVFDAAVARAFDGRKRISWMEVYAGDKANEVYGETLWLPEETKDALREYLIGIKGPLTTPVGGGIRSINVAIRQQLDLYACVRPVRYFTGVPSPVKKPEADRHDDLPREHRGHLRGDRVSGRHRRRAGVPGVLEERFPESYAKVRFPETSGIGIKPVSREGTERLVRAAIRFAIDRDLPSVTLVHKGNIMKFTEGAFRSWGYETRRKEFGATELDGGPWLRFDNPNTGKEIVVKDVIADAMLQQILTRPDEYSVVATLNLNGDYISDALAAQVGGIGIAPGANINYDTGHAVFEATHGTAPKYAGQDKVNPSSVILSGVMMFRHMGWDAAANLIESAMDTVIAERRVTYDFHRLMDGATLLKTSEFGDALIAAMER